MIKPKKKCLHQKHNLLSRPVRVLLCNLTVSDLFEKKCTRYKKIKLSHSVNLILTEKETEFSPLFVIFQ